MLTILETTDQEMGADVKILDGVKNNKRQIFKFNQLQHFDPTFQSAAVKLIRNTTALPWLGFCLQYRHVKS
jgi:hypothetical protein